MSLNAVAAISAVLGVPIAAVPVGLTIHGTLQNFRPKFKLKKWSLRVADVAAMVASKGDAMTSQELREFLKVLKE